ncbi:MAG: hypothetical protein AAFY69_08945 [Pseudomonadota bacterium]
MAATRNAVKRSDPDETVSQTFNNPETRERWAWVQQAIGFAELDSHREFECRFTESAETASSPFVEE